MLLPVRRNLLLTIGLARATLVAARARSRPALVSGALARADAAAGEPLAFGEAAT